MNFDTILQNVLLSVLWGLIALLITFNETRDEQKTALTGIVTSVALFAILWLLEEFDEETKDLIKTILGSIGIGFGLLILGLIILQVLVG